MVSVPIAYAETVPVPLKPESTLLSANDITSLAALSSKKYALTKQKETEMVSVIFCEAPKSPGGFYNPAGQSLFKDKKGNREKSFGLVQINLPYHPDVTLLQAQNASWSIDWMALQFSLGNEKMWSCYGELKASGKI